MNLEFGPGVFSYAALGFYLAAMLTRREILLRVLLLAGTGCYIVYYSFAVERPLWDAIIASIAIGAGNIYVLSSIVMDRTTFGMSARDVNLYQRFPTFNPGQFRRLMRIATWHETHDPDLLCTEGQEPAKLYFVHKGAIVIERGGQQIRSEADRFVGELSFMAGSGALANATVRVIEGSAYLSWDKAELRALLATSERFSQAFAAAINIDLSRKLHATWPGTSSAVEAPQ
ncbi:MAG: cyclic nucleotide-binding domain-containing protein [Pseudomonadota bacterium]